jgi:hypothetical protein
MSNEYCYVVTSRDGNPYDIGVFMTFASLIQYFKTVEKWKISDSITPEEFETTCARVWISVSKMRVYK